MICPHSAKNIIAFIAVTFQKMVGLIFGDARMKDNLRQKIEEMIDTRYPSSLLVFLEHSGDSSDVITAIEQFITQDRADHLKAILNGLPEVGSSGVGWTNETWKNAIELGTDLNAGWNAARAAIENLRREDLGK